MTYEKNHGTVLYSTDDVMRGILSRLIRDFRFNLKDPSFAEAEEECIYDIPKLRDLPKTLSFYSDVSRFKARHQINSFLKRYIFEHDRYNDKELAEMSEAKFIANQIRISSLAYNTTYRANLVLRTARKIVADILGEFSNEEVIECARFAKNATAGNTARNAYLDSKLTGIRISGSSSHIAWFTNQVIPKDDILREILEIGRLPQMPVYRICDELKWQDVPKSFQAYRTVMPDTTIGSFYNSGLGDLMTRRLRDYGINLNRLQEKHAHLVREYSVNRLYVTADLSAASDSITKVLVMKLLPGPWSRAVRFGQFKYIRKNGKLWQPMTFCTMGLGFTFPLQTIIYYSLLKAIQQLLSIRGKVSVFGDDLIYPTPIHRHVVKIFQELGFVVNNDKTFVQENFRESCGADFYRGVDVRPFQPKGRYQLLSKEQLLPFLYKMVNGLRERWSKEEISITLSYLEDMILKCSSEILQVPPYMPPESGVRVERPINNWRYAKTFWDATTFSTGFKHLARSVLRNPVSYQLPYYWQALRPTDRELGPYDESIEVLTWKQVKCKPWRGRFSRRRFKYFLMPVTSCRREIDTFVLQTSLTAHWK